jgi:hypothetical protein
MLCIRVVCPGCVLHILSCTCCLSPIYGDKAFKESALWVFSFFLRGWGGNRGHIQQVFWSFHIVFGITFIVQNCGLILCGIPCTLQLRSTVPCTLLPQCQRKFTLLPSQYGAPSWTLCGHLLLGLLELALWCHPSPLHLDPLCHWLQFQLRGKRWPITSTKTLLLISM